MCYGNSQEIAVLLSSCPGAMLGIEHLKSVEECPEDPDSRTITLGKFQCYVTYKASQLMSEGME